MTDDEIRERFLRWRDIEDPCVKCQGSGRVWYGSTATWRGGVGGASMTSDVCDECWGSGDKFRHGVNLRQLRDREEQRVAEAAVDRLCHAAGASIRTCYGDIVKIVEVIETFANKRNTHFMTATLAQSLANVLREACKMPKVKI